MKHTYLHASTCPCCKVKPTKKSLQSTMSSIQSSTTSMYIVQTAMNANFAVPRIMCHSFILYPYMCHAPFMVVDLSNHFLTDGKREIIKSDLALWSLFCVFGSFPYIQGAMFWPHAPAKPKENRLRSEGNPTKKGKKPLFQPHWNKCLFLLYPLPSFSLFPLWANQKEGAYCSSLTLLLTFLMICGVLRGKLF